jgi:hypothetical protein
VGPALLLVVAATQARLLDSDLIGLGWDLGVGMFF